MLAQAPQPLYPRSRAVLTLADVRVPQIPLGVLEVEGLALLAVASHSVVLAVVTNPPAGVPRGHVHGHVEMALRGVAVAVALCDNDKKHRLAPGEMRACRKSLPGGQSLLDNMQNFMEHHKSHNPLTQKHVNALKARNIRQKARNIICILPKLTFACVSIAAFGRSPG